MRKSLLAIALVIFLPLSTLPAQAAAKAGSACTKVGSTSTVKSVRYTCNKVGKRLLWEAVLIPAKTVPSAPAKAPEIPASFQELDSHLAGISYAAWLKGSQMIKSNNITLNNIHFLIGPNTKLNDQDSHYQSAIQAISNLYATTPQAKNVYIIYYGSADINWAQTQFEKYMDANYGYGNRSTAAADNCAPPNCSGGMAVHTNNFDSIILMGDSNGWVGNTYNPNQGYLGHTFAHEYTHTIQLFNMNPNWGNFPRWLTEGAAEWSALTAISSNSYEGYKKFRSYQDLGMQYGDPEKYNEHYILKILNPGLTFTAGEDINSYLNSYPHWDSYSIGLMVSEVLVALKDQNSLIRILQDINTGKTFGEAFEREFGVTWAQASPLIAHAIALEIKGKI